MDIWLFPNKPSTGPPDIPSVPCQKYVNSRIQAVSQPQIRIPVGAITNIHRQDIYEIPQGSALYYIVLTCGDEHAGFPNEYWVAQVRKVHADGTDDFDFP